MKKILLVVSGLYYGVGISEFLKEVYGTLLRDYKNYKIDIIIEEGEEHNEMKQDLQKLGINAFYFHSFKKSPIQYYNDWKKFLKKQKYDYVHFHIDNLVRFVPFILTVNRAETVIIHSHNGFNLSVNKNFIKRLISKMTSSYVCHNSFKKVSCSKEAEKWLFSEGVSTIIYNGINLEKFRYNQLNRIHMRNKYNLNDENHVILHIGRFKEQKNHYKLIEIFDEMYSNDKNYRLFLIGEGPLKEEILENIRDKHLEDVVSVLGYSKEIPSLLSMADLMVFPSLYEGFPISLVEAQASGLPIFYSDTITDEIEILSTTQSIDINSNSCDIAQKIHKDFKVLDNQQRLLSNDILKEKGFDIQDTINQIRGLYK